MWDFCLNSNPTQPIQWQVHPGLCPTSHQRKYTLHLKFSTSTKFSFYQQRWLHSRTHLCTNVVVRTLGALIPSYGVMQALDQVRSLSDSVQKLANDTVLALGNIKDTLASHKMMILQNRVALDYILATQGGACTIIGPECCSRVNGSNRELEQNPTRHSWSFRKLRQMTEDNSSWFGNLLGKPWLWIKEIAILLLFSPTCVLSMHPQYQCFCQQ